MSQIPKMLRPPKPSDLNFIYNSWLESFKDSPDNPIKTAHIKHTDGKYVLLHTTHPAYYSYQKLLIISILNRSLVSVLCNPDDPDQIYGYAVYELFDNSIVMHWLQIKYTFRKLGFASFIIKSIYDYAEKQGVFNPTMTITSKGFKYESYKDKLNHIYKPKLAFRLEEK